MLLPARQQCNNDFATPAERLRSSQQRQRIRQKELHAWFPQQKDVLPSWTAERNGNFLWMTELLTTPLLVEPGCGTCAVPDKLQGQHAATFPCLQRKVTIAAFCVYETPLNTRHSLSARHPFAHRSATLPPGSGTSTA